MRAVERREGRGEDGREEEGRGGKGEGRERRAVEGNRNTVLEPRGQPCYYSHNKLSTHNFIRKYFVENLVTAAPPPYSSAIRLWPQQFPKVYFRYQPKLE